MVREAISVARAAGAGGEILVRGDSAYGNSAVVDACVNAGVQFSVTLTKNSAVDRAIDTIPDDAWTPVHYPGAVVDPDTGELISDAEVAEVTFTAFASTKHPVTARLVVRRVRDRARMDELFPVWRYHPFFTNSTQPTAQADITHRRRASHCGTHRPSQYVGQDPRADRRHAIGRRHRSGTERSVEGFNGRFNRGDQRGARVRSIGTGQDLAVP
jgi:hypothetical protein